ncbi:uncharacterized protein LOC142172625 [Nicotiana tabacum]|uniref:Uncharacterized protein LOC142172625 n=1 Tax=Nicotiana tabacum TaxID=4097 RepID=A0AC58T599_TOBAC
MAQTYFSYRDSQRFRLSRLLQAFCAGFIQNSSAVDQANTEKCKVSVERGISTDEISTFFTSEDYIWRSEVCTHIFMKEIFRLHGIPVSIISDRGSQFTSCFWKSFQEALVTRVDLSAAFHLQTDGQSEYKRRRDLVFTIRDKVFLRVTPIKGVMRFGKRGKLIPRFIGPYETLDRVGAVAYHLALPPELSFIHPVFHVSMLRKCISDSSQVLEAPTISLDERLSYEEEQMTIVDRQVRNLRSKEIEFVKVLWRNHTVEEATWEIEDAMRVK